MNSSCLVRRYFGQTNQQLVVNWVMFSSVSILSSVQHQLSSVPQSESTDNSSIAYRPMIPCITPCNCRELFCPFVWSHQQKKSGSDIKGRQPETVKECMTQTAQKDKITLEKHNKTNQRHDVLRADPCKNQRWIPEWRREREPLTQVPSKTTR